MKFPGFIIIGLALCSALLTTAISAKPNFKSSSTYGKIRYRLDNLKKDQKTPYLHQISAILGFKGKTGQLNDWEIALATGKNQSPTSLQVNLGDTFSKESIHLYRAKITRQMGNYSSLSLGKMKNPLYRVGGSELLWDGDLTPEGLNLNITSPTFFGQHSWTTSINYWTLSEREQDNYSDDSYLTSIQSYLSSKTDDHHYVFGFGLHHFSRIKEFSLLYSDTALGNSTESIGGETVYSKEFLPAEIFLEFSAPNYNLKLFTQYVVNLRDENEHASYSGFSYGESHEHSAVLTYSYRDVDSNAVIGILNDSTFNDGSTGAYGHEVSITYHWPENLTTKVIYFNTQGESQRERIQLDASLKF